MNKLLKKTLGLDDPEQKSVKNMAERFRQNGISYFRFITTPGLEPTNNLAEQAIRFVVLDRYVTQGTRSESGQQRPERIWSAIATCTQQQRNARSRRSHRKKTIRQLKQIGIQFRKLCHCKLE